MQKKANDLKNKNEIEAILKLIEEEGFIINNKFFTDTYFIMQDDSNTICNFEIKQIPRFKFALWNTKRFDTIQYQQENYGIGNTWADNLNISPQSKYVFFTQFKRDLDKFKPSYSAFTQGITQYKDDESNQLIWDIDEIISILKYMSKHYYKAYYHVTCLDKYIWQEVSSLKSFYIYYKHSIEHLLYVCKKFINYKLTELKLKILTYRINKCFNYIVLDRGTNWSPRYELILRRKETIKLEKYEKQEIIVNDFYNSNYMNVNIDFCQVDIDKNSTKEDLEKDQKLKKRFNHIIKYLQNNKEKIKEEKILYKNI